MNNNSIVNYTFVDEDIVIENSFLLANIFKWEIMCDFYISLTLQSIYYRSIFDSDWIIFLSETLLRTIYISDDAQV